MWPNILRMAKEGGLNTIETYVFWNVHEPVEGQVVFVFVFCSLNLRKLILFLFLFLYGSLILQEIMIW